MPAATLQSIVKQRNGREKPRSVSVTITHNSRRLYHHSDGETYEYVGDDGSGNRIYRNTRKVSA